MGAGLVSILQLSLAQALEHFYRGFKDLQHLHERDARAKLGGDKQAQEQLRLISELDTDDRAIIFKMIDKMLTSKKFKDFFNKNVATL